MVRPINPRLLAKRGVDIVIKDRTGNPRTSQRVLFFPARTSTAQTAAMAGSGIRQEYVIVGQADMDIAVGDVFPFRANATGRAQNVEVVWVEQAYEVYGQRQARAWLVQ